MKGPRVSLDQWRALLAVVDAGTFGGGAERINKTQSALTYAVQKLESSLTIQVFQRQGRRSVLTPAGQQLVQRARVLLDEAQRVERLAGSLSLGWEAELTLAVEVIFPTWLLLECLDAFGEDSPQTHIELIESVMGGTEEALMERRAALALTPHMLPGFNGEPVLDVTFLPVASPEHPLHKLKRDIEQRDLRRHRHLVVRESGAKRERPLMTQAEQRWTVSNMPTSIGAACRGYGYTWLPEEKIRQELAEGSLKPLPLIGGRERRVTIYLILADPDTAGPGVRRLADIIREKTALQRA